MAAPKAIEKAKENSARRVVKQGHLFMCGMCGTRYGSEAAAESCLKRCIKRYMDHGGVQDKADKKARTVYRCIYCKRVYEDIAAAKECAKHCKQGIQKRVDTEARLKGPQSVNEKLKNLAAFVDNQLPPDTSDTPKTRSSGSKPASSTRSASPASELENDHAAWSMIEEYAPGGPKEPLVSTPVHPAQGIKFTAEGDVYRCTSCHQKYRRYQDAIACFDLHAQSETKSDKDSEEKFSRDGAKYVCRKCSKKWLSRTEVLGCYDAHLHEESAGSTNKRSGSRGSPAGAPAEAHQTATASRSRRPVAQTDEEKYFRDGAKYVCRICSNKHFTRSDVIHCYDKHTADEQGGSSAASAADTGPTLTAKDIQTAALEKSLKEVKVGPSRDGEDKFFRNGAKYVCRKCKSKYLTRQEVIDCFDKH